MVETDGSDGFVEVKRESNAWIPEEVGDVLVGVFMGMEKSESYEDRWLVEISTANSEENVVVWANKLLHGLFVEADPKVVVGDVVKIVYEGKGGKKPREYHRFRLLVKKPKVVVEDVSGK